MKCYGSTSLPPMPCWPPKKYLSNIPHSHCSGWVSEQVHQTFPPCVRVWSARLVCSKTKWRGTVKSLTTSSTYSYSQSQVYAFDLISCSHLFLCPLMSYCPLYFLYPMQENDCETDQHRPYPDSFKAMEVLPTNWLGGKSSTSNKKWWTHCTVSC